MPVVMPGLLTRSGVLMLNREILRQGPPTAALMQEKVLPGIPPEAITAAGILQLPAKVIRRLIPSQEQRISQVIIQAVPQGAAVPINQTPAHQGQPILNPAGLRRAGVLTLPVPRDLQAATVQVPQGHRAATVPAVLQAL